MERLNPDHRPNIIPPQPSQAAKAITAPNGFPLDYLAELYNEDPCDLPQPSLRALPKYPETLSEH